MPSTTLISWKNKYKFSADLDGHQIIMDAKKENGGEGSGPSPKILLLAGLGGCTGMDIVSILKKMHFVDFDMEIKVDANSAEEYPQVYNSIAIYYRLVGDNIPVDKIKKAVKLSEDKYCSVMAMLRKTAEIKTIVVINDLEV